MYIYIAFLMWGGCGKYQAHPSKQGNNVQQRSVCRGRVERHRI